MSAQARAMVEESERFYASGGRGKSQEEIEEMLARMSIPEEEAIERWVQLPETERGGEA